jgi:hypothetical protein
MVTLPENKNAPTGNGLYTAGHSFNRGGWTLTVIERTGDVVLVRKDPPRPATMSVGKWRG